MNARLIADITYILDPMRVVRADLAPHSDSYCAARGIRPARDDWAANETVELPAVEFRRNVLVAAAEMVGGA